MRNPWYALAALLGCLSAFAVWSWPERPLWQSGPEVGTPIHFSPDSQVLVTQRRCTSDWQGDRLPVISRWDAATGQLLSRVQLDRPGAYDFGYVRPSPHGPMVLMHERLFPPSQHHH